MREHIIAGRIADIVMERALENNARRIFQVNIILGGLTMISEHHIGFFWDMVTSGTIAQGASLHFERMPIKAFCPKCLCEFVVMDHDQTCPRCEELNTELISGDEYTVEGIFIEARG